LGVHRCAYCSGGGFFDHGSSGDVFLQFDSGVLWQMPDMILHYVADHEWLPPQEFVNDVMKSSLMGAERWQTKSITKSRKVGYLEGEFARGIVPEGFVEKLEELMEKASGDEFKVQYRNG